MLGDRANCKRLGWLWDWPRRHCTGALCFWRTGTCTCDDHVLRRELVPRATALGAAQGAVDRRLGQRARGLSARPCRQSRRDQRSDRRLQLHDDGAAVPLSLGVRAAVRILFRVQPRRDRHAAGSRSIGHWFCCATSVDRWNVIRGCCFSSFKAWPLEWVESKRFFSRPS